MPIWVNTCISLRYSHIVGLDFGRARQLDTSCKWKPALCYFSFSILIPSFSPSLSPSLPLCLSFIRAKFLNPIFVTTKCSLWLCQQYKHFPIFIIKSLLSSELIGTLWKILKYINSWQIWSILCILLCHLFLVWFTVHILYAYILVTEFPKVIFQYVLTELICCFTEVIGQFLLSSL